MLDVVDYEWRKAKEEEKEIKLIVKQLWSDGFNGYVQDEDFYLNRDFNTVMKGIRQFIDEYKLNKFYDEKAKKWESDYIIDFVELAVAAKEKNHREFCRKQCRML